MSDQARIDWVIVLAIAGSPFQYVNQNEPGDPGRVSSIDHAEPFTTEVEANETAAVLRRKFPTYQFQAVSREQKPIPRYVSPTEFAKTHKTTSDWVNAMKDAGHRACVFERGQQGSYAGHPATVDRHYQNGMYEVTLPSGMSCIAATEFVPIPTLPAITVRDLYSMVQNCVAQGMGDLLVCTSDGEGRYPFQLHQTTDVSGKPYALTIGVRPDAHFQASVDFAGDQKEAQLRDWNVRADQIKTGAGAFSDRHHPDAPSYADLKTALEAIWNANHPDAALQDRSLRGITEAEFGQKLVRVAGKALGHL